MTIETAIREKSDARDSMQMSNIVLSARELRKAFDGQVVLDNISLDLRQGEVILLRGENGSGKTTLINILTGNLEPDRGELNVSINGNKEKFLWPKQWWKNMNPFDHFTPERLAWEGIGRVWQDIRLFPTMTTLDNIAVAKSGQAGENPLFALAASSFRKDEKENLKTSIEWLKNFGLADRYDSSCDKISLGQMKRVAIARAIQAGAKILFLDEPLAGLDKDGVSDVLQYLESLVREKLITLVIVEHLFNIPHIVKIADTVWTLSHGKLTVNKTGNSNENESELHELKEFLNSIAKDGGRIMSEELPHGARLTTAVISEDIVSNEVLKIDKLTVKRGIRKVIDGLSLSLKKGNLYILEAPNGWGKSSLLDAISGIHMGESGTITLNGREISALPVHKRIKAGLAYLRSDRNVFSFLSVEEHRKLSQSGRHLFNGSLNESDKGSFLSGGEKQKLLIEILPDADVYLLDEPFSAIDPQGVSTLFNYLRECATKAAVLITVPYRL